MEIRKYTEKDHVHWEKFVAESNNGTIFHYLKFLGYHPADRFQSHHLVIRDQGNLVGVFPAVCDGQTIISHRGASYGGLVLKSGLGVHDVYLAAEHLVHHIRDEGYKKIILTQPPLIYYAQPDQYIDFALQKIGFHCRKREITAVIPLDAGDPLETFRADARRSTKKALREGVRVRISDDITGYYGILKNNLGMRHNVTPTHSLAEIQKLKGLFPEDIILFAAYLKEKMLGGILVFAANARVLLAFYISHDDEYQSYRPVNLLFYEVIRWGRSKGFRYLDLGTFTINMEPNWGLARFKENSGARGYLRDTYEIDL